MPRSPMEIRTIHTLVLSTVLCPIVALTACRQEEPAISLAFAGDVNLGSVNAVRIENAGGNFAYAFEHVMEHMRSVDAAFVNLECCISARGENLGKKYSFRAPPQAVEGLAAAGIDIVSVSNNHSLDYGPQAYEDTVELLAAKGVKAVGLARGEENRQEPVIMSVKGKALGFLAYAVFYPPKFLGQDPRPAKGDWERIDTDINFLRPQVDFLIVSMHWGQAEGITDYQRRLGHHMVDLGADVVAGHGPHVLQPHEYYGQGIILYSLGNFVFKTDYTDDRTETTTLARVTLRKGRPAVGEELPCKIDVFRPVPESEFFIPLDRGSSVHE